MERMDSDYDFKGLLNRYRSPNDIDKNDGGFVGLEYVIRIVPDLEDKSLMYECILCTIHENGIKMQQHLLTQKHRFAYLKRHFPTVLNEFYQYINNKKFDIMDSILDKLCEEIEVYHGKGIIKEFPYKKFIGNKHSIYSNTIHQRHPSETNGPSFMDVVTTRDIDAFLKNQHLSKETVAKCERVTFDPSYSFFNVPISSSPKENYVNSSSEKNVRKQSLKSNSNRSGHNKNSTRPPSPNFLREDENENENENDRHSDFIEQQIRPSQETVISTRNLHSTTSQIPFITPEVRSTDAICENNNFLLNKAIHSLDLAYKGYIRNIDTHPGYNSERLKFHQEKLIELEQLGIDVHTYDYHKEWIAFFTKRIHELYNAAIRELHVKFNDNLSTNINRQYNQENRLNVFNNQISNMNSEQYIESHSNTRGACNEQMSNTKLIDNNDRRDMNDSVESITILRVLAAFEDDMGRLGSQIVQLLTKCLRREKIEKNSSIEMLLCPDHCMLLKNASEHLERQVIDFPRGPKVDLFKKLIFDIQNFIARAGRPSSSSVLSHNTEQNNFHRSGHSEDDGFANRNQNFIQPLMSINSSRTGSFQTIGESQQNIGNNSSWQHMQQNQNFCQQNLASQQFVSQQMAQHHLNAHYFAQQHALANTYPQFIQQNNNTMQQYCMQPNSVQKQFMQPNSIQEQFMHPNSIQEQFMQSHLTQQQFMQPHRTQQQFMQSDGMQLQAMEQHQTQQWQTNRSTISENTENQNSGNFSPNRRKNKETKYLGNSGRVSKGANKYSQNRNSNSKSSDRNRECQTNCLNSRFKRPRSRGRSSLTRTGNQSKPKNTKLREH